MQACFLQWSWLQETKAPPSTVPCCCIANTAVFEFPSAKVIHFVNVTLFFVIWKATAFNKLLRSQGETRRSCRFVRSRTWTGQALLFRIGRRLWQRGRDQQVGSTQHTVSCSTHSHALIDCSGMHSPQARTNTLEAPSVVCLVCLSFSHCSSVGCYGLAWFVMSC